QITVRYHTDRHVLIKDGQVSDLKPTHKLCGTTAVVSDIQRDDGPTSQIHQVHAPGPFSDSRFPSVTSDTRAYVTPFSLCDEIVLVGFIENWIRVVGTGLGNANLEHQIPHANLVPVVYRVLERSISFVRRFALDQPLSDILAIDECSIPAAQVSD